MKGHELLAVESNLETQAAKCAAELANTFEKKRHLFEEKKRTFWSSAENVAATTEEESKINSTVEAELAWIKDKIVPSWDASLQVSEFNTRAKADIVMEDGSILAKDVPATALLELEKRLTELQKLFTHVPTLDPAKGFSTDSVRGKGYWQAREIRKNRTQKVKEIVVLYPHTTEHPAQTQLVDKDVVIGYTIDQEWSSLITPGDKSEYLTRIENLSRAVRKARSRANDTEVNKDVKFGVDLMKYILGS